MLLLFAGTWELWEFQAASHQPRLLASNGISVFATKVPPLNQAGPIRQKCRVGDTKHIRT